MERYGNIVVMGESAWIDSSITGQDVLEQIELGYRAWFDLHHHDITIFGEEF